MVWFMREREREVSMEWGWVERVGGDGAYACTYVYGFFSLYSPLRGGEFDGQARYLHTGVK